MIKRTIAKYIKDSLKHFPSVAILGPRQSGKTTLAKLISRDFSNNVQYLDLENPVDAEKIKDPEMYFQSNIGNLIILDEIQRVPPLFPMLRGTIDRRRMDGYRTGQFLLLGSSSGDLLKQASESLAGRIVYTELSGFTALEVSSEDNKLWLRGGYPDSFLSHSDERSFEWRDSFIRSYLEREIPQIAYPIPAEILRRLWTMLAHLQGSILNQNTIALSMGLSVPTITRYLSVLSDLFLIRYLRPYYANVGKRLVKSPKIYIRDSGVTHALLNIASISDLLAHPVCGPSFEGFVIENVLSVINKNVTSWYYRTSEGAEIDLLLEYPSGKKVAIEIKLSMTPKLARGFHTAYDDLKIDKAYVVYPGKDRYPISANVEAIGLEELLKEL